jgi:hypothetical protein
MDKPFLLADNRFCDGVPTATGSALGSDPLHIRDLRTYTFWSGAAAGTNYLTVDCGQAKPANTLAIVRHNLGSIAARVSVEVSTDGANWTTRLAPFVPQDDRVLVRTFIANARYYRLKIVTTSTAPRIAVALLGVRLEFPNYLDSQMTPFEEKVVADSADSKSGELLGVQTRYFPFEASFKSARVPAEWYMGEYRNFWDNHGKLFKPFVFAVSLDTLRECVTFCRMHKSATFKPNFKSSVRNIETFDFRIEGVSYGV